MRARLLGTFTVGVALCAVAGCGSTTKHSSTPPAKLVAGYAFGFDEGDLGDRVAFSVVQRRAGIQIEPRELGSPPNAVVALDRGDVQLATMPYLVAINAIEQGAKLRIVLGANMVPEFVLVAGRGIASVADLRGKRIAYDRPGLDGQTLVLRALQGAGIAPSAASLVALQESAARVGALTAGRIDAADVDEAGYLRLHQRDPTIHVLARLTDFRPRAAQTVWVVSERYAQQHRALLRKVIDGLVAGYQFDYTAAGRSAWRAQAGSGVLEDEPQLATTLYAFYRRVRFWPTTVDEVTQAQHERLMRFWIGSGQLDRAIPFAQAWDTSF